MKSSLLLLIFFLSLKSFGQKIDMAESQKENFKIAEQALKNFNGLKALTFYHLVYLMNLDTKLEPIAKKRIDSLLPLFQKSEAKKWKGKWNLGQLKTNKFDYEKIVITDNDVLFYSKKKMTVFILELKKLNLLNITQMCP